MYLLPSLNISFTTILLSLLLISIHSYQIQTATTLPQLHHITFTISPIQQTIHINLSLNVCYLQTNNDQITTQINIFTSNFTQTQQIFKYSIWNFQNTKQNIIITISSLSINLTSQILKIGSIKKQSIFTAIFDKDTSNGYMLPFNMFNQKLKSLFVIAQNTSLSQMTYNLQPFMSTYWTEIQSSMHLFPHFPYLSQCSIEKSYIILNDLIQPQNCYIDNFFGLSCNDKNINFNCIIQQLQVLNVDLQFWFNKNQQILFYLFKRRLSMQDFTEISNNIKGINTLILSQFNDLIPVYYSRYSSDTVIVNQFIIEFQVELQDQTDLQILKATVKGYYNPNIPSPFSSVHTHIRYLNIFQNFNSYNLPIYWYIAYALLIDIIFISLLWSCTNRHIIINLQQKIKNILSPAIKGCIYTYATGGIFFFLINQITYQTSFSTIASLFGDTLINQSLQVNNVGRNGLVIGFIGFYLLIAGIKQAFKVSESEELKIVFQDFSKLDKNNIMMQQQLVQRIQFTKKNMVSQKKSILISSLFFIFFGLFFIEITFSLQNQYRAIVMLIIFPILSKLIIQILKEMIIKEILYICGHCISIVAIFYFAVLKNGSVYQFTYLYAAKYFNIFFQIIFIEICFEKGINKIDENSEDNRVYKFLSQLLKNSIDFKRKQSQYQRALYLSSFVIIELISILLIPLTFLTFFLIQRNDIFNTGTAILFNTISINHGLLIMFLLIPLEVYTIFVIIEVLKKYDYRIEQVIKFNRFKFKRRKFRWMNDEFSHSKNINFYYRQYQKFSFSSQIYFIISLLGYSCFLIYLSLIIILKQSYLFGNDPAVLIMLMVVIILGDILSIIISFIAIKLKLYQKKQQEAMRQNLIKTDKYLKNNDINEFLQLEGVKDYFLIYNKNWIIQNLNQIFQKQDFQENNNQLITKYKYYKSIFKKKQIQEKRRMKKLKEFSIINTVTNKVTYDQILLNKKQFMLTQPIMYYWFYLAKQNLYLKNIINCVKKQKIKKNCQFCNLDIELEALEKKEFQELANQFRVLNVNKIFDANSFLEFYRLNQKYITICMECKEKNLHLENKINLKEISSKLVKRWHLMAKSRILHKQ